MFFLKSFVIGIFGYVQHRRDDENSARKRLWDLHQVPGFPQSPRALESDVKQNDRPARAASQHYRAGLGHVGRPARTDDGEAGIDSFCEPPRHDRKSAQTAARRTSLRRAVPQSLNHATRPLAIEIRCVHEHTVAISEIPCCRNDATMPE